MSRIWIGIVVIGLTICGYFGIRSYAQYRAEQEVDTVFATIRATGVSATHGPPRFDLWSRSLTIADITLTRTQTDRTTIKIGRVVASGVGLPTGGRASVGRTEVSDIDIDIDATIMMAMPVVVRYRIPNAVIEGYVGPIVPIRTPNSGSVLDLFRLGLEHIVAVDMKTLTIPALTGSATLVTGAGMPKNASPSRVTYRFSSTGMAIRDVHDGRVGSSTIGRIDIGLDMEFARATKKMTSSMADVVYEDIDAGAMLAALDPANTKDDVYRRIYRRASAGRYVVDSDEAGQFTAEAFVMEDVGLRPSKLQIAELISLANSLSTGVTPTPENMSALLLQARRLCEASSFARIQLSGLSMRTPDKASGTLAGIRLDDWKDCRLGEIAVEGFDVQAPSQPPVKIGRLAVKSLDIANLMQAIERMDGTAHPEGIFKMLSGFEIAGLVAPIEKTGETISIHQAAVSWGRIIGDLPTTARITANITAPIGQDDAALREFFAASDRRSFSMGFDIAAEWDERSLAVTLAPLALELVDVGAISGRAHLLNVSSELLSNPATFASIAPSIGIGQIELVLRDSGGVGLAIGAFARQHNMTVERARTELIGQIKLAGQQSAASNPGHLAVAVALATFLSGPRHVLTLTLTPKWPVQLLEFAAELGRAPDRALADIEITAAASR